MAERVALVVNPEATRVSVRLIDEVHEVLATSCDVVTYTTQRRNHAAELADAARADGATIVAVLGGDGTVADIAAALADSETALLPVAGGSTNVFTRAIGWPHPGRRALPAIRRALRAPQRREILLGRITTPQVERTFCVNAGFGIDAETVQIVESHPWIKHHFRNVGFGVMAVAGAIRASRPTGGALVTVDDGTPDAFASLIAVTGSPYAYVGSRPLDVVPGATFDGELRWLGIRSHRADILAAVLSGAVRANSPHLGTRGVHDGRARSIAIRADHPIAFQADGEPLGWHREATIGVGPRLTVIVPPDDD